MTFLLDNLLLIGVALASGGLLLWPLIHKTGGAAALSPLQATQLINHRNAFVVDLRDEKDFALGSLAGARNVPFAKLKERASEFARLKTRPVLLVCDAGQQSTRAIADLKTLGVEEAHALAGGISAWKQAGLPLVQPGRETNRPAVSDATRKTRNDQRSGQRAKPNRGARTPAAVKPTAVAGTIEAVPAHASSAEDSASVVESPTAGSAPAAPAAPATGSPVAASQVIASRVFASPLVASPLVASAASDSSTTVPPVSQPPVTRPPVNAAPVAAAPVTASSGAPAIDSPVALSLPSLAAPSSALPPTSPVTESDASDDASAEPRRVKELS